MDAFRLEETLCTTTTIQTGIALATVGLATAATEPQAGQEAHRATAGRTGARVTILTVAALMEATPTTTAEAARTSPHTTALPMQATTPTTAVPELTAAHIAAVPTVLHLRHRTAATTRRTAALLAHMTVTRMARRAWAHLGVAHPEAARLVARPDTSTHRRANPHAIALAATTGEARDAIVPVHATVGSKALGPTTTAGARAIFGCPIRATRLTRGTCECRADRLPKGSPHWMAG